MIKQEQYTEQLNQQAQEDGAVVNDIKLREELKPLWVACYFERRLSKI